MRIFVFKSQLVMVLELQHIYLSGLHIYDEIKIFDYCIEDVIIGKEIRVARQEI